MRKKQYYYDSRVKKYYAAIKDLAYSAGGFSGARALLEACQTDSLGEEQRSIMELYYPGGKAQLARRVNEEQALFNLLLDAVKNLASQLNIPLPTEEEEKKFSDMLLMLGEDCDFRTKVHSWTDKEKARCDESLAVDMGGILPGFDLEEYKALSISDYLARYESLLAKRQKRQQRKKTPL